MYVVGAWLAIQVADVLFPAWGLPETSLRYLFIAAAFGFPVALVFGWFFDITSHGIVRTDPAGEQDIVERRLRAVDYAILAGLAVIGAAILLGSFDRIQTKNNEAGDSKASVERPANSVAVLPFKNLDANADTGFFSDGVTEEILQRLSMLGRLHVLASTSSFAFRGSDESPSAIGQKLGVRYILQGSVRREGEHVRITARLMDEKGFQLWSESFDRKLDSIFVIQTEIASRVASKIVNEIVPVQQLPAGRTTAIAEAYEEYLKGKAYFDARTADWKERARVAFAHAIELDPEFAPPYAGMASLVVNSSHGPHWQEARALAERALQLDPDLPFGHAVLGLTESVLGEDQRGVESLRRAIELDPSLAAAYQWIAVPLGNLGLYDEATAMQERGLEIDPLNPVLIKNTSDDESRHGGFERAEQLLLRLTHLPSPPGRTYVWLYELYERWDRYDEAIDAAKNVIRLDLRNNSDPSFFVLAHAYANLGLVDDADFWFRKGRSQWTDTEPPLDALLNLVTRGAGLQWLGPDLQTAVRLVEEKSSIDLPYVLAYGGLARIQIGDLEAGVQWLERSIAMYQQEMASDSAPDRIDYVMLMKHWDPDLVVFLAQRLAFAYKTLGHQREADVALRFLHDTDSAMVDLSGPRISETRALNRLLSGDTTGAAEQLRRAVALGWANYYGTSNDPAWAEAFRNPAFKEPLDAARRSAERQRSIALAADSEHDFRAEVTSSADRGRSDD